METMNLNAEMILKLHVQCEEVMEVRDDGSGYLRVIPIVGGTFEGKLRGEVVSGGADWNTIKNNEICHVFAKYLLKTDDGEYIAIENEGKLTKEDKSHIKTSPRFQADTNGKYAWLNSGVYVGSLEPGSQKGQVELILYKLG